MTNRSPRIEGYAIVSQEGMIARSDGSFPKELEIPVDQAFYRQAIDRASAIANGRHSAEGGPGQNDRKRILLWTQVLSTLQSVALAALTLTDVITVTHLLLLQLAQGVINAFDTPARQALVVEMVEDRADVPNAIALNSTMVNGSRIVGPAVGGLIIAAVGEGWCFALDAFTYVGVVISIAMPLVNSRPSAVESLTMGLSIGCSKKALVYPRQTLAWSRSTARICTTPRSPRTRRLR